MQWHRVVKNVGIFIKGVLNQPLGAKPVESCEPAGGGGPIWQPCIGSSLHLCFGERCSPPPFVFCIFKAMALMVMECPPTGTEFPAIGVFAQMRAGLDTRIHFKNL
jgi:hypothetical protein